MPEGELRVELTDRQVFMMASMVTYFLAVLVGTYEADDTIHEAGNLQFTVYTAAWSGLAGATIATFIMAFRLSWKSSVFFLAAYIFQLLGVSMYLVSEDPGSTQFMVASFLVFLSYAVALSFIWKVKDLRDTLLADPRIVVEYIPLGLWALQVMAAVTFLLASLISFQQWAEEGGELYYFILYQVIYYGILLYVFILPEKLEFVVEKQLPEELRRSRETAAPTKERKRAAAAAAKKELPSDACPLCGGTLMRERRVCPECSAGYDFMWCPYSEEYIINCPFCSVATPYGRERCMHCGRELQTAIRCPACSVESPLSNWTG